MSGFTLHLQSATQYERLDDVTSFIGEDASGSFGLQARHTRFMTVLGFGLARYRCGEAPWQYLALPGGVLYFVDNELFVSARRYVRDDDYARISAALSEQLRKEEAGLQHIKDRLRHMEQAMLQRMREMQRA